MKKKTFYYTDPVNDDFAETDIDTKPTPEDHEYISRSPFFAFFAFIIYRIIARPLTYIYIKIAYHHKFVNKGALKSVGGQGFFLYGNHTLYAGDAFIPNHMTMKKNYIVSGPDVISIPGIRTLVRMLGAIPVPSTVHGAVKYKAAIDELIRTGSTVTVYPEAHIWPFYTGIRPFPSDSFSLPVSSGAPCFAFTNVYFKSRNPLIKRPVVKTFIDGPFFPDESLPRKERAEDLRNRVYDSMIREATKQEQYVTYRYVEKSSR